MRYVKAFTLDNEPAMVNPAQVVAFREIAGVPHLLTDIGAYIYPGSYSDFVTESDM